MSRLVIALFFLLGMEAACAESELPVQSRPIDIYKIKDGYEIAFDNSPLWSHEYIDDPKTPAFVVATPEHYYPPATVTVRFHKGVKITQDENYFKELAASAIETSAQNNSSKPFPKATLHPASYDHISGYWDVYTSKYEGVEQDNKIYIMRGAQGQLMSLIVSTLPGKLDHIEAASTRIFESIKFLDKKSGS